MKRVRCETSAAMVPKDKAIKRFLVRPRVPALVWFQGCIFLQLAAVGF